MVEQEIPTVGTTGASVRTHKVTRVVDPNKSPTIDIAASKAADDKVAEALRQGTAGRGPDRPLGYTPSWQEDSVVIQLPNKHVVELGPPNVATAFIIAKLMGETGNSSAAGLIMSQQYFRALMYVRTIDGASVPRPTTMADAQALANGIGDIGMEHLVAAVSQEWPLPDVKDLQVLKKNVLGQ